MVEMDFPLMERLTKRIALGRYSKGHTKEQTFDDFSLVQKVIKDSDIVDFKLIFMLRCLEKKYYLYKLVYREFLSYAQFKALTRDIPLSSFYCITSEDCEKFDNDIAFKILEFKENCETFLHN